MMHLTLEQIGVLKGALATAAIFSTGIGIGLFFLHRKHEEEMDKLEKDTALTCLGFATEHYEGVIRHGRKAAADNKNAFVGSAFKTPYYEAFLKYQCTIDSVGKYEPTEEEWVALEQNMILQQKEHEKLLRELEEQKVQMDVGLDRLKLKLLAKKAIELVDKASCTEPQLEIDTMNNSSESKE